MYKQNKLVMPLILVLLFLNNIDTVPVSAAERASLSNTQKELIIENIQEHDSSDMSNVSTNYPAGTSANTVNWMVYWSAYDAQYYLLYFPPVDYVSFSGSSVKIQCSPFSEPYSCYCFYYKFSGGKLVYFYTQGHHNAELNESYRGLGVYRLSSLDDIVACSISLYDKDGLELFDTDNNPDGLKPSGGGSGEDSSGGTEDGDSGILGFLKGMLKDIRNDIQAIGSGISSLVNGIGDIIQNALKAVFVPSDGFLNEKLTSLKTTVGAKFGLSSMGEIDSWMTDMKAYKPETRVHFMGHYISFVSLDFWEKGNGEPGTLSFYFKRIKDFLRVFLYPVLLFGNWKYMVWVIRGSGGVGEQ